MKISKRKLIGVAIISAAVLAALAFQFFGGGLIVTGSLHPATTPDLAARGVDMAGGQHIDLSRLIVLGIFAVVGFAFLVLPSRDEKPVA